MALTVETSKITGHFRSVSLPSSVHPLIATVQDHLTRLTSTEEASSSPASLACQKLGGLKALYGCLDDWLQLLLTQQDLSLEDKRICIEELLDGSLKLVDVCGNIREFFSETKDNIQELQSSTRRRKGVEEARISRRKLSKVIMKYSENLKSMSKHRTPRQDRQEADISILKEAKQISLDIFHSLLCFLSGKKARSSNIGWSSISNFFSYGQVSRKEEENMKELDVMESIQEIEDELEGIFQHLVKTRVYLLNVLNH